MKREKEVIEFQLKKLILFSKWLNGRSEFKINQHTVKLAKIIPDHNLLIIDIFIKDLFNFFNENIRYKELTEINMKIFARRYSHITRLIYSHISKEPTGLTVTDICNFKDKSLTVYGAEPDFRFIKSYFKTNLNRFEKIKKCEFETLISLS